MSDASTRDYLANERTFLAWVRTSISLMGFGVVIAKLRFLIVDAGPAVHTGLPAGTRSTELGLAFAVAGLLTLLFSLLHYEQARRAIEEGKYLSARRTLYIFTAVVFLLGLASIAYLFALAPR